jgi:hypothetical protein
VSDEYGNILHDTILEPNDLVMRKKIANVCNKFEDLIKNPTTLRKKSNNLEAQPNEV